MRIGLAALAKTHDQRPDGVGQKQRDAKDEQKGDGEHADIIRALRESVRPEGFGVDRDAIISPP